MPGAHQCQTLISGEGSGNLDPKGEKRDKNNKRRRKSAPTLDQTHALALTARIWDWSKVPGGSTDTSSARGLSDRRKIFRAKERAGKGRTSAQKRDPRVPRRILSEGNVLPGG